MQFAFFFFVFLLYLLFGYYVDHEIFLFARAFSGWTVGNADYMERRAQNDSLWPYGRLNIHFEYHTDKHDFGDKTFLGETGDFSGEDIVDIICKQPATARFIARHMYNFFVADEGPVPQWNPGRHRGAQDR